MIQSTRKIIETKDGSKTIYMPDINESYHSLHGAVQEAQHVFIHHGFENAHFDAYHILEIGFGTGLNTILTLIKSQENVKPVHYTSLEAHPVSVEEIEELQYVEFDEISEYAKKYKLIHQAAWNKEVQIDTHFTLLKSHKKLEDFSPSKETFNLIYFDAFGPRVQPKMWSYKVLQKMYHALMPGGFFVTYCAKGEVRRNLLCLGFTVEKLPGPPGKREMLRACKPI